MVSAPVIPLSPPLRDHRRRQVHVFIFTNALPSSVPNQLYLRFHFMPIRPPAIRRRRNREKRRNCWMRDAEEEEEKEKFARIETIARMDRAHRTHPTAAIGTVVAFSVAVGTLDTKLKWQIEEIGRLNDRACRKKWCQHSTKLYEERIHKRHLFGSAHT